MQFRQLLVVAMLAIATVAGANAATIAVELSPVPYQQIQNRPCVIGESSCTNWNDSDPIPMTQGTNPGGQPPQSYDLTSPLYTGAEFFSFLAFFDVPNFPQRLFCFFCLMRDWEGRSWQGRSLLRE